jgi:hypothetical protein
LQQEENHKDDDDAGRRQRLEQRPGELQDQLERRRVGLADLDGNRLLLLNARREDGGSVRGRAPDHLARLGDLVAEIAQHRRGAPDNAAAGRPVPKRMDFLCNVVLVSGQVLGQMRKLAADQRADAKDHQEGEHDHDNDGEHAIEVPTAQQHHRRPERKTQEEGEGHRNKDFPPEVERGYGNNADGQRPQTGKRRTGGMDLHRMRVGGRSGGVGHGGSLAASGSLLTDPTRELRVAPGIVGPPVQDQPRADPPIFAVFLQRIYSQEHSLSTAVRPPRALG